MLLKYPSYILSIFLLLFLPSCEQESQPVSDRIIIGVSADAESLNPLFAYGGTEIFIAELLYPNLIRSRWDSLKSSLIIEPFFAENWEWSKDSTSITFFLRDNAYWTNGEKISAEDIIFSFDLYSDPDVQSRFYGSFESFLVEENNHINMEKTFEKIDSFTVKINFKNDAVPQLIDFNLQILPKHVFNKLDRKNLISVEKDLNAVTGGPMVIKSWNKNQSIILNANKKFFLYDDKNIDELIFKIVPDYNSRITQLKKGEIDIVEDVRTEDVKNLENENHLVIDAVEGREYDYVGWNNIDPFSFKNNNIKPHNIFGSKEIRKALTYAINRQEIADEFLGKHGHVFDSPLAPIFKDALNKELIPLEYNPSQAKEILAKEGWVDKDNDNILEKGDKKFSFKLYYPTGNPRREFSATIIKNNLNAVGINVTPEALELQVLVQKIIARELDAWIFGFSVAIPPDLKPMWHSDISKYPFNVTGYINPASDELLDKIENENSDNAKNIFYKKFQEEIYKDMPVTFLFWIDNIVVYNNKVKNINITPLGAFDNCWQWRTR